MLGDGLIFQQDNATPHTALETMHIDSSPRVERLHWPPSSGDLSPIEHVCEVADQKLSLERWNDFDSFKAALLKVWSELQQDKPLCRNLMKGMRERLREVVRREGGRI